MACFIGNNWDARCFYSRKIYRLFAKCIKFAILVTIATQANSQDLLFSISQQSSGNGVGRVQFVSTSAAELTTDTRVSVPLPDGSIAGGTVAYEHSEKPTHSETLLETTLTKVIRLDDGAGYIELHLFNQRISAMTIFQKEGTRFHRVVLDSTDTGVLMEEDPDNYLCLNMPFDQGGGQRFSFDISEDFTPSLSEVQNLESKPGASNVIYIDYWGGSITVSGDGPNVWNTNYGDPFEYDAYDLDGSAGFDDYERYNMHHAWLEAAEDYAPFDVNVTTRLSVYESASLANRSRIIATPSSTRNRYDICNSACGGVAYLDSFGQNYYSTGFTFNAYIGSMGMTHSHEAGHQMDLSHDGTSTETYYSGHGQWGPIMGAPFYQPYVQWSKGQYPDANNTENDYNIINAMLGSVADDVGDTTSDTMKIETFGITQQFDGLITPAGFTGAGADQDVFKLDLTGFSQNVFVDLQTAPRFGVETFENPEGEDEGANLALRTRFYESTASGGYGALLADEKPTSYYLYPNDNVFSYEMSLSPGVYFLRLTAYSPDSNWSTGWGGWGHGGQYRLKAKVTESGLPLMLVPGDGVPFSGPTQNFEWTNGGADIDRQYLHIGKTLGGKEYYASPKLDKGTEAQHFVNNLPTDGSTVYVRIWSFVNGGVGWRASDTEHIASVNGAPRMVAPLPEVLLENDFATFIWDTGGVLADNWHVYIGSRPGFKNIYNSGGLPGSETQVTVTSLPDDGRELWLRLWYKQTGVDWQYIDTMYRAKAANTIPVITAPWPGSPLGDQRTVYWSKGTANPDRWRIYAGSAYGASDFTFSGNLPANTNNYIINGWGSADEGNKVWVRLSWRENGVWKRTNESFVAGDSPSIPFYDTMPVEP